MILLVMEIEFHVVEAHSLKEKRMILKSLIQKIKGKWNVSIAEVGYLDKWQRSLVGLSAVSNDKQMLERIYEKIMSSIEQQPELEILTVKKDIEYIDWMT